MRLLPQALFLFALSSLSSAQSIPSVDRVKDIRLLDSNREDVSRLLSHDVPFPSFSRGYRESFSLENEYIEFTYSTGNCSDEGEEWKVPESVVTSITIFPKYDLSKNRLGIDLSKFIKQRTNPQSKEIYVLHNKSRGIAVEVFGDRANAITLFPGSEFHSLLCDKREVQAYYRSKRWTREPIPKNLIIDYNRPANVVGLTITPEEDNARKFVVLVDAKDPENDILTYNFSISAGRIIGVGRRVVWDLIGAEPGTHKLTAAVDDGCGICGKYISQTVVIK